MTGRIVLALCAVLALPAAVVPAEEDESEEKPTMELLEFLGEWETREGNWVDPAEVLQMKIPPKEKKDDGKKTVPRT